MTPFTPKFLIFTKELLMAHKWAIFGHFEPQCSYKLFFFKERLYRDKNPGNPKINHNKNIYLRQLIYEVKDPLVTSWLIYGAGKGIKQMKRNWTDFKTCRLRGHYINNNKDIPWCQNILPVRARQRSYRSAPMEHTYILCMASVDHQLCPYQHLLKHSSKYLNLSYLKIFKKMSLLLYFTILLSTWAWVSFNLNIFSLNILVDIIW